jgi:hypothetical protein
MSRKIILGLFAALVLIGGWLGFSGYQESKFSESIRPSIKNASLRMTNTLRYELDDDTKITYKELFEKIESDISEIDKKILEVQSLEIPKYTKKTAPAIDYMKKCQNLLRALLQKYRKQMEYSSAMKWVDSSLEELKTSHGYSFDYAKTRTDKAIADLTKAGEEYSEARADVLATSKKLLEFMNTSAKAIPSDIVLDSKMLSKIIEKNTPKPNPSPSKT